MLFIVVETHSNKSSLTHENISQLAKFAAFK